MSPWLQVFHMCHVAPQFSLVVFLWVRQVSNSLRKSTKVKRSCFALMTPKGIFRVLYVEISGKKGSNHSSFICISIILKVLKLIKRTSNTATNEKIQKPIVGQGPQLLPLPLIKTQTVQSAPAIRFDHRLTQLIVLTAGKLQAFSSTSKLTLDILVKKLK